MNPIKNSGNANACVGQQGYDDALKMVELTAKELGLNGKAVADSYMKNYSKAN